MNILLIDSSATAAIGSNQRLLGLIKLFERLLIDVNITVASKFFEAPVGIQAQIAKLNFEISSDFKELLVLAQEFELVIVDFDIFPTQASELKSLKNKLAKLRKANNNLVASACEIVENKNTIPVLETLRTTMISTPMSNELVQVMPSVNPIVFAPSDAIGVSLSPALSDYPDDYIGVSLGPWVSGDSDSAEAKTKAQRYVASIAQLMDELYSQHGKPILLFADNHPEFTQEVISNMVFGDKAKQLSIADLDAESYLALVSKAAVLLVSNQSDALIGSLCRVPIIYLHAELGQKQLMEQMEMTNYLFHNSEMLERDFPGRLVMVFKDAMSERVIIAKQQDIVTLRLQQNLEDVMRGMLRAMQLR